MGEFTRRYRYTGQGNVSAARSVAFSKFKVSGDKTSKFAKVVKIQYVHTHTSTTPYDWKLCGRLVLDDGTTFDSNFVTKRISGDTVTYTNTFETLPTPEQFARIKTVQTLNSKKSTGQLFDGDPRLYWRANSSYPMDVILTFSDIPDVQPSGIKSVTSITLDGKSAVAVSINKLSERARHTVTWKLGSYSYTSGIVNESASYVPPIDWLRAVTTAKTGTGTVVVKTYADDDTELTQQIGDDVTATFKVTVPNSARPVVASGWASASPYNAGQAAGLSNYIQGYSKVKLAFDASKVTTYYGATIKSYSYTVQGNTVTASDLISGVLKTSGSSKIVCTVTDSRGMTNDVSLSVAALTINVLAYAEPKLNSVTVLRSENAGPPTNGTNGDAEGRYIYAKATAVTSSGVGLKSMVLMYREKGLGSYKTAQLASGTASVISGLLADRTYEVVLTVTDNLSNSYSQNFLFVRTQRCFNVKNGGKAIGIGAKAGDDNTVRVGWKVVFEEGFDSFVPIHPVGTCMMLDSGIDPVALMGGKWTEISWSYAPAGVKLWKRTE